MKKEGKAQMYGELHSTSATVCAGCSVKMLETIRFFKFHKQNKDLINTYVLPLLF